MVTKVYPKGMWKFLANGCPWLWHDWSVIALSEAYVYSPAHEFVADLGEAVVAYSAPLENKWSDNANGDARFGALDAKLRFVRPGTKIVSMALCQGTGTDERDRLVGYWEVPGCVVPDGCDCTASFPQGVVLSVGECITEMVTCALPFSSDEDDGDGDEAHGE